tara:strand:- start:109 stop:1188 length:1080 start_codon:yes stop_codon:yes gene_type:complete
MKKLLAIVVLGLFALESHLLAKNYSDNNVKVQIISKDENHIRIKVPKQGMFKASKYLDTMPNIVLEKAKSHCSNNKKNTYIYYRSAKQLPEKPISLPTFETWYSGSLSTGSSYNFICAKNSNKVFKIRNLYHIDQTFSPDYRIKLKKSEMPLEYKRIISEAEKKEERFKAQRASELNKKRRDKVLAKLEIQFGEECTGSFFNKKFEKGSKEYNNCLLQKEVELKKKQIEIDKKLAAMTPKERHAYNCSTAFKFRKGTEKYNDCVFKLYTAELDMQKLELEKQVAEAQIKAAATQQARAEAVANAQVAAAKASARASSLASSIELMRMGSSMMKSPAPAPSGMGRVRTTCRNVGGFLNCY